MKEHDIQAYLFEYHQYSKPSCIMNQIKPMNQFTSVLQILIILIQHKQLNHGSYSLYFGSKILSHYAIDKKRYGREAYKFGYHPYIKHKLCYHVINGKKHGNKAYKFESDQANESIYLSFENYDNMDTT